MDPLTNKKGRCIFDIKAPEEKYMWPEVKSTRKGGAVSNPSIPAPKAMPLLPDEHGGGSVPEQGRPKKIRKVRRKGHG
jgi:hypothetical protein